MLKLITTLSTFTFLIGCATTSTEQTSTVKPQFDLPEQFETAGTAGQSIHSGWLKTFNDPQLDRLITEVLNKNFDLQSTAAKVEAAEATAKQAGATLKPVVNFGLQGTNQGNVKSGKGASSVGASLDVSWEIDVWGRLRAGVNAAQNELQATKLDYQYAKLSLAAQTAKAYFLAIETGRQLRLTEDNVANFLKTKDIVDSFFEEGLVGMQDVHLVKSQLASANDALENNRAANLNALRSLEVLLGRYPSSSVDVAKQLPKLPEPIAAGIPSQVLERRPDIVSAERRVAAAFNKISEAKAAKLPRISLTSSLGSSAPSLSEIINPANIIWNVISNIMFPLFDGGNLESQVDSANAGQKQALANYQKTALAAFNDIETALSNETIFRRRVSSLNTAYQEASSAEKIGIETYTSGEGNILDVQQLQRTTTSTKSALLTVEHELLIQRVNIYLGLGGDI